MSLKTKLLIVLIVFLIISGLFVSKIISPVFGRIKARSQAFLEMKRDLAGFVEKSRLLPSVKQDYEVLKPSLEMINNLFVDVQAPVSFLNSLEKAAYSSGVSIDVSLLAAKTPGREPAEAEEAPSLNFKVVLLGSFSDCLRFVDKAENLPYLITIEDLSIRRLTEANLKSVKYVQYSFGDVELTLSVKVLVNKTSLPLGLLGIDL